ncbi:MAG: OTU domain, ubiquitin aldehyde binding [Marteilia pararefringens]
MRDPLSSDKPTTTKEQPPGHQQCENHEDLVESKQQLQNLNIDRMRSIEREVQQTQALVGQRCTIDVLFDTCDLSFELCEKFADLLRKCNLKYWHPVRRDGNCFYRSLGFLFFKLIADGRLSYTELKGALERRLDYLHEKQQFDRQIIYDFMEIVDEAMQSILSKKGVIALEDIFDIFNDDMISNSIIVILRYCTTSYLLAYQDDCFPFIDFENYLNMKDFTQKEVEPMGQEADNLQITALIKSLDLDVTIFDVNASVRNNISLIKINEECKNHLNKDVPIFLLFVPGHYEILYD